MVHGKEPELFPWRISEQVVLPQTAATPRISGSLGLYGEPLGGGPIGRVPRQMMPAPATVSAAVAAPPAPARMRSATAETESSATATLYLIKSKTTIKSNDEPTKVTISLNDFSIYFRYSAIPKLISYTYLKAKFTNNTDSVFLPGESHVFVDNSFVATSTIDLISPNEESWVYLGIDEGIKVERKLLHNKKGESGFIRKGKDRIYEYLFEITNNKNSDIEIVLWDQLPISENEKIEVKLIEPRNIDRDDSVKTNDQKYIEWIRTISPGKKVTIPFKYSVSYPSNMNVIGL